MKFVNGLKRSYFYNASYQLFSLFLPLLTMPYTARVLGPSSLGIHSYTAANTQYFILVASIGITYGCQQISANRQNKYLKSQIFWELLLLRLLISAFVIILFFIFTTYTKNIYRIYYFAQSLQIIAITLDTSWFFQGLEKFKLIIIRNFLIRIVSAVCIFVLVKDTTDLLAYIYIISLTALICNLLLFPSLKNELEKPHIQKSNFLRHIKPAILLLLPEMVIPLYVSINKTILGITNNISAVAYFENADRITKVLITFITASGAVLIPRINYLYAHQKFEQIKKIINTSFLITNFLCLPISLGMLALSKDFSLLFFSNKFSGIECFISIDTILIIIIIWSNVIGMQFLIPTQRMKQYFYSVTIGAFVNLLLVYPFILILHDIGVVYATIIAEVAVTSYQFYTVRKHLDIQQMLLDSSKILIAAIIMFMTLLYVNQLLSFSIWHFMLKIVVGVIIYILLILILFFKTLKRYILNNYASS